MRAPSTARRFIGLFSLSLLAACNAMPEGEAELLESDMKALAVPANFLYRQGKQLYLNGAPYQSGRKNASSSAITINADRIDLTVLN